MPEELEQAIKDNAAGPARAAVDGQSVEQHSLRDQIDADRYLASKEAVRRKDRGLRLTRLIPPGTEGG
ncbi:MAG: hypothetical protein KJZ54_15440 [Phycisphaerales bacterium]|nr:hypothetical protein [Phycisphaerales bacterium]